LFAVLPVLALAGLACKHGNPAASAQDASPPTEEAAPAKRVADNSRCHVCHINYEDEKLAVTHAGANIGCERCHGASDAHCSDEDNVTPPDVMFPLSKVNAFCMKCHRRDAIDIKPHQQLLEGTAPKRKRHCTDCHGEHRLGYRSQRWDKTTGRPAS